MNLVVGTWQAPGHGEPRRSALVAAISMGFGLSGAEAQDRAADFSDRPILVLDTGGHHAMVRRLVFTQDESRLLSAGEDKVVRDWDLGLQAPRACPGRSARRSGGRGSGAINAITLTACPMPRGGADPRPGRLRRREPCSGEIGLYRFPGAADRRQGDVEGLSGLRGRHGPP